MKGRETSRIDWPRVKARLRASDKALEGTLADSPESVAAVYRKRAAQLAQKDRPLEVRSAEIPALIFTLADETYAVRLSDLSEVLLLAGFTPVPGARAEFLGVMNLRGELRPILDLRSLLHPRAEPRPERAFLLMLRRPGREIGLLVDRVEGLRPLSGAELIAGGTEKFSGRIRGEPVPLLDIEKILEEVFFQGASNS